MSSVFPLVYTCKYLLGKVEYNCVLDIEVSVGAVIEQYFILQCFQQTQHQNRYLRLLNFSQIILYRLNFTL